MPVERQELERQPVIRVPFHVPSIGEEEIAEVVDTLRSGWLTTGPKVGRFEHDFAAVVGARHAVALNSATAALHLALEAAGVRSGDEVVIPTYTFAATGEVVTYLGARPVLVDCGRGTLNIDASTIEPCLTSRTKAIIPVHIAGLPCDMDPILDLARRWNIQVIEDAAHALPTTYKGRLVGTLGDLTAFSFYATKTITTGEGGMVTTEREDYAVRIKQMSLHGLSGNAWSRYTDKGRWYYEIEAFGFKYNLTDLAAALGLQQLRRIHEFHQRRQQIARMYNETFAGLDVCHTPHAVPYGTHAWHLYILDLNLPALRVTRNEVIEELHRRGVATSVHFRPLHLHPIYGETYGYRGGQFPSAEAAFERAVSLPIYPRMTDGDVGYVVEAVLSTLKGVRR
jgi:perosamine synthetase